MLCVSITYGQSKEFSNLEKKIKDQIKNGQWDEVLVTAPDLLIEDPSRGEGYYYTSLAFLKLNQPDKAEEYLQQAEALADEKLQKQLDELKADIKKFRTAHTVLENAEKQEQSGNKRAADEWQKLWEMDKTQISYALNAVELYVEQKNYPQAIAILDDPALSQDQGARDLRAKINKTPEMFKINGYNDAMKLAASNFERRNFSTAISNIDEALRFRPNDAEAASQKRLAQDELAWSTARQHNTLESFDAYLAGNTLKKHKSEAQEILKKALIRFGKESAAKNDVEQMDYYLKKYLKDYPYGADTGTAKTLMCETYLKNANTLKKDKYAWSQSKALSYYSSIQANCPGAYSLESDIKLAKKKEKRYGRPDRFFVQYVYDTLTPIGLSIGGINNRKLGFYMTGRLNQHFLSKSAYYTVNNQGEVDGNVYEDIRATNSIRKGYFDGGIGLTKKIAWPLWIYAGGGINWYQQWEEMSTYYDNGGLKETEWVKNSDEKKITPMVEAGFIVDLNGFNIRAGGKMIDFKDMYYSLGVGFSFRQ